MSDMMFPPTHRDGIPFSEAPKPRRLHRCTPWTTATFRGGRSVQRCACGAIRVISLFDKARWRERNSRGKT